MDLVSRKAVSDLLFKLGCDLKPEDQAVIIVALGMIKGLPSVDPEEPCNCPLTWEELKTMEGKPVWIEGCGFSHGFWVIIDYFSVGDEDFIALGGKCDQFWKQDMTDENNGESWQAFRNEVRGAA